MLRCGSLLHRSVRLSAAKRVKLSPPPALRARFFQSATSLRQSDTIEVTVDGQNVNIPNGATVMFACEAAGVDIPRFCYHDRLSIAGNCRMCLVEIEKSPKPVASCAMPAMPGMKIKTNTELVHTAREGVMELLLVNHPLDCPICDQGGECDLQDQSMVYGSDRSRTKEMRRAVQDKNLGPLIRTVMTRCIHCTRCVRFAEEIAGVPELGVTGRGNSMEIGTYVSRVFDSELSGNIIDLCPVGALTSKPYQFVVRPWELKHIETIDIMDAVGANITIDARGVEVLRIKPRLNEEVNEEWLSDKSRFSYDGLKRQRLDKPMVKRADGYEPITWPEAFDMMKSVLQNVRGGEMKAITGDLVDVEGLVALKDLMNRLGCGNLESRQDSSVLSPDLRSNYISNTGLNYLEDSDLVLLVATNPRMEAPLLNARLRKASLQGTKVASIGPLANLTYQFQHLGDTSDTLLQIAEGRHPFSVQLAEAQNPVIILGMKSVQGESGQRTLNAVRELGRRTELISEDWNGINFLHLAAARCGALDVGFTPGVSNTKSVEPKFVYLLGADEIDPEEVPEDAFVVYQGHHGDQGALLADIVFPSTAYTEKSGTYVNLDGRVQRTKPAISRLTGARDDWQIIRALSEVLDLQLPYDTVEELRERACDISPHLRFVEEVEEPYFNDLSTSVKGHIQEWESTAITPNIQNFFQTDPISRASQTMAEASATLHTSRNSYEAPSTEFLRVTATGGQ